MFVRPLLDRNFQTAIVNSVFSIFASTWEISSAAAEDEMKRQTKNQTKNKQRNKQERTREDGCCHCKGAMRAPMPSDDEDVRQLLRCCRRVL